MAASKAPRWGVHYRLNESVISAKPKYAARSSFVVRGRSRQEAISAAKKDPRLRGAYAAFDVRKLS